MDKKKSIISASVLSLALFASPSNFAVEISDVPVFALGGVEPNLLIALDNSSSMDDERLVIGYNEGRIEDAFSNRNRPVYFSSQIFTGTPPLEAVAVTRSSAFNATYYNPNITYKPWTTFGDYGESFPNSDPKKAAWYPLEGIYPWTKDPIDLTQKAYYDFHVDDEWEGYICDNNGNTINMRRILVRVGNGAGLSPRNWLYCGDQQLEGIGNRGQQRSKNFKTFRLTYDYGWAHYYKKEGDCGDESTWYPKPPCLTRVDITDPGELQNFANWFTYYRDRLLILKGSLGEALAQNQSQKFNAAMFPINIEVGGDILSFEKDDFDTNSTAINFGKFNDNRGEYLKKVYELPMLTTTPLRDALFTAGEIYAQTGRNKVVQHACQANYTILFTDGYDTEQRLNNIPSRVRNSDNNANEPYKGSAGFTLADFSHYYYHNLSARLASEFPIDEQSVPVQDGCEEDNPKPWLDCNDKLHMTTFTIGMGAKGNFYDPKDPNADSVIDVHERNGNNNPNDNVDWANGSYDDFNERDKIDDLLHTALNGKGEIENANNPQELTQAFTDILERVLMGDVTNSGVDASDVGIDANEPEGRYLFRAMMNLSANYGDIQATLLKPDGTEDPTLKWSAEQLLAERNLTRNPRKIATYSNGRGVHFTWDNLTRRQRADLRTPPPGDRTNRVQDGKERLAYIAGDTTLDGIKFRKRSSLLGAIASSTPIYNGKPMLTIPYRDPFGVAGKRYSNFKRERKDRRGVVYAGANDGMLHAFDAKTGEEVFAYIPNLLFSTEPDKGLHYLTRKDMELRSYVDLPVTIHDVYLDDEWKSILVGGLRTGGPGIFVLNVTDPVSVAAGLTSQEKIEAAARDLVIGEYVDPGMGIMLQKPYVAMMNNGRWAAVFSSGYAENGKPELQGQLYIVYLDKGRRANFEVKKIPTGRNFGLSPATLADIDGNGTVDRVYAGDLSGNMWTFDLTADNDANWRRRQLFAARTTQPITSPPAVAANPYLPKNRNGTYPLLVAFGTGKYLSESDRTTIRRQSFYVIADNGEINTRSRSVLHEQKFINTTDTQRSITGSPPDWVSTFGWYIDLPMGEKIFVQPDIYGENVSFFSSRPSEDGCDAGGKSWFTALKLNGRKLSPNPYTNIPEFDGDASSIAVGDIIIVGGQPIIIGDNRITIGRGNNLEDFEAIQAIDPGLEGKRTGWEELLKD